MAAEGVRALERAAYIAGYEDGARRSGLGFGVEPMFAPPLEESEAVDAWEDFEGIVHVGFRPLREQVDHLVERYGSLGPIRFPG